MPSSCRTNRSFLDRLGGALNQQQKILDGARQEFEKRRVQWSEKRIEAESLKPG